MTIPFLTNIAEVSSASRPWSLEEFNKLSQIDKMRYLVSQGVILNYLERAYNSGLPLIITE